MLGMADGWITTVYVLCLLSALLCVVYGVINWNKGGAGELPTEEDKHWAEEEDKLDEEL